MIKPLIREAKPGDEMGIHDAHMRSIREVCILDHGEEEVRGWGNRSLGDRWKSQIRDGSVWVVEFQDRISGVAYIQISKGAETKAHIFGLYLAPEVLRKGLGAALLRLMLDKARNSAGVRGVTLDSTLTAHDFYKRFGFRDNGPMKWTDIGGSQVRSFPMILELLV